jgi:predicted ATPase
MSDALTLAYEVRHPYSLAWAQFIAAWLLQYRREGQAVLEHAEAIISLSTTQEFPLWAAWATALQGWARAKQGEGKEGLADIYQGLALYRTVGAELLQSYFLALLAETCGETGQIEEGLPVLAEALAAVHRTGEHFWEAELYRLKGTLTLQKGVRDWGLEAGASSLQVPSLKSQASNGVEEEAERCFLKAIEIARKQSAKSLELRAAMSLARLWRQQGKRHEAHSMLVELYGWFTEGFDTKDLQEAKRLLSELR